MRTHTHYFAYLSWHICYASGLLWCLAITPHAFSSPSTPQDFETLLSTIYSRCEEDVAYETLQDRLWEYYHTPMALNQASREALRELGILTEIQIEQFQRHVARCGPLVSIYELQAIPGFDLTTIQLLVPFVKVEAGEHDLTPTTAGLHKNDHYVITRYERTLETKKGYQHSERTNRSAYAGTPGKYFTQVSLRNAHGWTLGLTFRKGAGETWSWNPDIRCYGPALWRFHGFYQNQKACAKCIVGDYEVGYGQGLVLIAGFHTGKNSEAIKVMRTNNRGIRPHTAVAMAAFRGLAATWRWRFLEFTAYYSHLHLDGTIRNGTCVTNVSRGGYYRTQSEIARKGSVKEQMVGGTLVYKSPDQATELGMNLLGSHYNVPIDPKQRQNNPFCFRGKHHANLSLFGRHLWHNLHFFGEGALSKSGGGAAIGGVVASLSRYLDTTILWRYYSPGFHNPYGKNFRGNTTTDKEHGIYLAIHVQPYPYFHVEASCDGFDTSSRPGSTNLEHDWLGKLTYQLSKTSLVHLQCKVCLKKDGDTKQDYTLQWQYLLGKASRCKSTLQCNRYRQHGSVTWGWAGKQDVTLRLHRLQCKGSMVVFNAPSSRNMFYFHPPSLLGTGYNFLPYRGQGMNGCILARYQATTSLCLEFKHTLTYRIDKSEIGSGNEAIQGNFKNEVALQIRYRF